MHFWFIFTCTLESNVGAEDNNEEQETAVQTSNFPIISCSGDEDDGDLNEENENEDSDIEFFVAPDGLDRLGTFYFYLGFNQTIYNVKCK